jgi:hypothetical protein
MRSEFVKMSPPVPVQVQSRGKWRDAELEGWQLTDNHAPRALIRYVCDGVFADPMWAETGKVRRPRPPMDIRMLRAGHGDAGTPYGGV